MEALMKDLLFLITFGSGFIWMIEGIISHELRLSQAESRKINRVSRIIFLISIVPFIFFGH